MDDFTPTTHQVRDAYGWTGHDSHVEANRQAKRAEFDRWLVAELQRVRRDAWHEGKYNSGPETPNPYTEK